MVLFLFHNFNFFGIAVIFLLIWKIKGYHLPNCQATGKPEQNIVKLPDPENIKRYFVCENNILVSKMCENYGIFDENKSECVNLDPTIDNNYNNRQIQIRKFLSVYEANDDYKCSPGGVFDDVYPDDCQKYYHCDAGKLSVKKCSYFKKFDPLKLECRWSFLVDCKAKPSTTTTTTTTTTTSTTTTTTTTTEKPKTTTTSTTTTTTTTERPTETDTSTDTESTEETISEEPVTLPINM
ncbi:uncharacterized protein LOC142323024 [Lycorma delicatula]|uniref:uncharacterized protein LOC142323024 n=1 Tax=Lycorma delicatula TaxID=130591 RepID=UPI003F514967